MCLFTTDKKSRVEPWDEPPRHRSYYSADRRGSARVMRVPRASDSYTTVDRYSEYDHNRHSRAYVEDDYVRRRRESVRSSRDLRDYPRDRDSYYSDDETEVDVVTRRYTTRERSRSRVAVDPPVRRRSRSRAEVVIERRPSRRRRKSSVSRTRKIEILRQDPVIETRSPPRIRRAIMPPPPALGYGTAVLEPPRVARVNAHEYRRELVPEVPPPPIVRTPASLRPVTPVAPVGSTFGYPQQPYGHGYGYPQPEVMEDFVPVGEVERREEVGEFAGIEVDKVRRESVGYPRYEIRAPRIY